MATESRDEESLVKYDTAILVSTSVKNTDSSLPPVKKPGNINADKQSNEFLNDILPPKETHENGKLWVSYVSPTPATKQDVILLKERLDRRLEQGKARDVGICPIREKLFS